VAGSGEVDASLALALEDVSAFGLALGRGRGDATWQAGRLAARLDLPARRLDVTAEGPLRAEGRLSIRATVADVDLAELIRALGGASEVDVGGTLGARFEGEVPLARPGEVAGVLRVSPLRVRLAGQALEAPEPLVARWRDGALQLDRLRLAGPAGTVSAAGTVRPAGPLDLRLRAELPLAVLAGLRPEIERAAGRLDVTASVSGTTQTPVVEGEAFLRDATLVARGLPGPVTGLNARVTGSPAGLRLVDAQGAFGGGTVRARGRPRCGPGRWTPTGSSSRLAVSG
jgi:hypothetical protein